MCDTNLKNKVCIIPIDKNDNNGKTYKINTLDKVAYPFNFIEIKRTNIINVLRLKGKVFKIQYNEFVELSDLLLNKLAKKT